MLVNFLKSKNIAEIQRISLSDCNLFFYSSDRMVYFLYDEPRPDKIQEVQNIYNNILHQLKENPNGMVEVNI